MSSKIFTEEDYLKFFFDIGDGVILKHWYVDYLQKAAEEIAPKHNGDHQLYWKRIYQLYEDFVQKWQNDPCHFHICFRPGGPFNEYVDKYTLLKDIIDRMTKLMQKDYPDLYFVATEDKLYVFL